MQAERQAHDKELVSSLWMFAEQVRAFCAKALGQREREALAPSTQDENNSWVSFLSCFASEDAADTGQLCLAPQDSYLFCSCWLVTGHVHPARLSAIVAGPGKLLKMRIQIQLLRQRSLGDQERARSSAQHTIPRDSNSPLTHLLKPTLEQGTALLGGSRWAMWALRRHSSALAKPMVPICLNSFFASNQSRVLRCKRPF